MSGRLVWQSTSSEKVTQTSSGVVSFEHALDSAFHQIAVSLLAGQARFPFHARCDQPAYVIINNQKLKAADGPDSRSVAVTHPAPVAGRFSCSGVIFSRTKPAWVAGWPFSQIFRSRCARIKFREEPADTVPSHIHQSADGAGALV